MISFDQAMQAKTSLRQNLRKDGHPEWLRGIGVSKTDEGDHYIVVYVSDTQHPEVQKLFPSVIMQYDNVRVVAQVQDDIKAQ